MRSFLARLGRISGVPGLLLLAFCVYMLAAVVLLVDQQVLPDSGIFEVFLLALTFPILLMRARLELDGKDPFRLYVGDNTYVLHHATGIVEGASKMGTTDVHGGGGGGYIGGSQPIYSMGGSVSGGGGGGGYIKPVTISSTTTIQDQFFLRQADGQVAAIKLKDWDFSVADGHLVSAVWAVKEGASGGSYVALRNHSTRGWASSSSSFRILRRNPFLIFAVELYTAGTLAFGAVTVVGNGSVVNPTVLYVAAFGAVVIGIFVWNRLIKPRFYNRWARRDSDRIRAALDAIAAPAVNLDGATFPVPATAVPTTPSGPTATTTSAALAELVGLRDQGQVTQEEYESKRREILARL